MILSREQIAQADDLKIERVPVPEWGPDGEVLIKTMSGTERAQFEEAILIEGPDGTRKVDNQRFFSAILSRTLVGEDGALLFSTPEEVQQLMAKNGAVLLRLSAVASRINGLSKEAQEAISKNLESGPNGASSSGSL